MLRQWGDTCIGALETMIEDIRAGRLYDGTLRRDYAMIQHLMGRRDVLTADLDQYVGPHRGPGTPGYREIGGDQYADA